MQESVFRDVELPHKREFETGLLKKGLSRIIDLFSVKRERRSGVVKQTLEFWPRK